MFVLLVAIGMTLSSAKGDLSVEFFDGTYEEALSHARKQKKPMFLDFYADWCMPCKQMDKYTFTDPDLAKLINDEFVPFKVNVDFFWGMDIADSFEIKKYPTIMFTDKKGKELRRAVGFKSADDLKTLVKKVLN